MIKAGIDQDALITMFAEASAKQGEALRKAVSEATLRALQGRELTLDNIKKVVKNVAEAASAGIARNPAPAIDVEGLLGMALGGIDSALLQAVEANRKALALEVAKKGVTVNTISPGYIGTKMVTAIPEEILASKILPQIPVGRLGKPEEVAGLIIYLASEEAAFLTGANIAINGGQHMQ